MTFRTDLFEVGDQVTWFNDHYAKLTGGRKRLGEGPFEIVGVQRVKTNFRSVGHLQHVKIDLPEGSDDNYQFSGAFFKKI